MADRAEQLVLEGVRVLYASVIKPSRFQTFDNRDQWAIRCMIPKSDKDLVNRLARTVLNDGRAQGIFGKDLVFVKGTIEIQGIRSTDHQPLKDGDRTNVGELKGHYYIQAKTTSPPQVVDQQVQPIMQDGVIYDGCYCNVAVAPKSYSKPQPGMSWFLNAVQFVRPGPEIRTGPVAGDIFSRVEDDDSEAPALEGDPFGDQPSAPEQSMEDLIG